MKNIFSIKNKKQIFLCLLFTLFSSISFCQTKDATMIRYVLQKQEDYFVVGNWHLKRTIGNLQGIFSLLFKKINGEWFIAADHSS
jgi:hypothetical protein